MQAIQIDVFPAHAGMSLSGEAGDEKGSSFPRSRGDEPKAFNLTFNLTEFSPLTRG